MSAADTPQPTKRAAAFMAANALSPVVRGDSISTSMSVRYVLEDGTTYTLDKADQRSLPRGHYPRWLHG